MDDELPAHSFGIATCGQMLRKLARELERLARGTFDPQTALDHALNCALTADSMVEGVWQLQFRRKPGAQRRLAGKVFKDKSSAPLDFRRTLSERCEAVRICYDVARGAKHVFVEHAPTIVARTDVVACDPEPAILDVCRLGYGVLADDDGSIPSGPQYLPMVKMGETTRSAIGVFDQVTGFWTDFLRDFDID